jgi:hypothetical protein
MRFSDWPADAGKPLLGDVIAQTPGPSGNPDSLQRAYRVVGVEETRTGYRLVAERIAYAFAFDLDWLFFNVPRR